jgi:hypothetical protein
MISLDPLEILFVATAFIFQIILIIHFVLRKWRFELAMRYGLIVYALSIPAAVVSTVLLLNNMAWSFWFGGYFYLIWGLLGYLIEYRMKIEWRDPIRWSIFGPYVLLYLATNMFYWFPLALIWKPLWYIFAILFLIGTSFNVTSHKVPRGYKEAG